MIRSSSAWLASLFAVLSGCSEATVPIPHEPEVLITTTAEWDGLRLIAPGTGRTLKTLPLGEYVEGTAPVPDRSVLYVNARTGSRRELVAVDMRSLDIEWRLPLSTNWQSHHVADGIGVLGGEKIGVWPDGSRLYTYAIRNGVYGIAAIAMPTRQPVAFSGPWNVSSITAVPPSAKFPQGALALVASRNNADGGPFWGLKTYLLDPYTLTPTDSLLATDLDGTDDQETWQVVSAHDGHTLYIAGSERLAQFDLVNRRVTASVARASLGALTLAGNGQLLILTDAGRWPESPGSGLLHLYGSNLEPLGTIDVSSPLGGHPYSPTATVTGLAVASLDGRTVYAPTGTFLRGPLYPIQPARILAVDVAEKKIRRVIELGGYGLRTLVVHSARAE